ncbi:MAG TPA: acyltransferase [Allosphingosinicella sp.]|nr:acyltransferase [Allosphingosinicella sp.]
MMQLVAGGLRRISSWSGALGSLARRAWAYAKYPGMAWPRAVIFDRGVRILVTDGARLSIGPDGFLGGGVAIVARFGTIDIGPRAFCGQGTIIAAQERISIGSDVLIAEYVTIRDQDHDVLRKGEEFRTAPIVIGDRVWIGAKATITRGVSIGDGAVIGANAVVTRDVPANSVAAGVPAKVIRLLDGER